MFVRPTSINTVRGLWQQLLPLHLLISCPELQLFIGWSELNKVVIPVRKEQTDRPFLFRFSLALLAVLFFEWVNELVKPGRECGWYFFRRSFACALLAASSPPINARERDHQLHQLHVNLYQFYYFIWLLLVTKKQSISNRPLWPSFSAPFLSLIYPWVFSAVFLYRGYSATCRAPVSLSRLWLHKFSWFFQPKTPDFAEKNFSRGQPFFLLL